MPKSKVFDARQTLWYSYSSWREIGMSRESLGSDEISCPVREIEALRNSLVRSSCSVELILPLNFVSMERISTADQLWVRTFNMENIKYFIMQAKICLDVYDCQKSIFTIHTACNYVLDLCTRNLQQNIFPSSCS